MDNEGSLPRNLAFDLDAIEQFIFDSKRNTDDAHDNEITETYGYNKNGKEELLNKVVHDVQSSDKSNKSTIKYDLIKTFISILDEIDTDQSTIEMSLGDRIVLNTMTNYGFIKEIE